MSDQEEEFTHDGNGAGAPGASVKDGEEGDPRLAALVAERDETKDRMLRIAADFENWKKRARKEQEDGEARVREAVIKDMLDVMDNLERAVSAYAPAAGKGDGKDKDGRGKAADGAAILQGVGLVLRLFQSKLERYGVTAITAEGQPFDPRLHEAISRVETQKVPAGSVAAEMQRGYRIGDRLLRPSMVSVAVAPADAKQQGRSGDDASARGEDGEGRDRGGSGDDGN